MNKGNNNYSHDIYELYTMEEEVLFVAEEIAKLGNKVLWENIEKVNLNCIFKTQTDKKVPL